MTPDITLIATAALIAAAGLIRGYAGFGSGLIMVPGLALLHDPVTAVVLIPLIEIPASAMLLPQAARHADWRTVLPLGLAMALAVPAGVWLLLNMDADVLKICVAASILLFAALLAAGWHYPGRPGPAATVLTGLVSGLCGGAFALPGPPITIMLMSSGTLAREIRAAMIAVLGVTVLYRVAIFAATGSITRDILIAAAVGAPFYLATIWIGGRWFKTTSERLFRNVLLVLVSGMAVALLLR